MDTNRQKTRPHSFYAGLIRRQVQLQERIYHTENLFGPDSRQGFPRTRGDRPTFSSASVVSSMVPPHTRG